MSPEQDAMRTTPEALQINQEDSNSGENNPNHTPNSQSSDQPDQEPELDTTQNSLNFPNPNVAIETLVPDDEELVCDLLTCHGTAQELPLPADADYAWRMELEILEVIRTAEYMPFEKKDSSSNKSEEAEK